MLWMNRPLQTAFLFLLCFIAVGLFQNCGYIGKSAPEMFMGNLSSYSTIPSFAELNDNIFKDKCASCHYHSADFTSYSALMAKGTVVPFNASASSLYQRVLTDEMPQGGPALSAKDKTAILNWINAGAKEVPEIIDLIAPTNFAVIAISDTSTMLSWTLPAQTVFVQNSTVKVNALAICLIQGKEVVFQATSGVVQEARSQFGYNEVYVDALSDYIEKHPLRNLLVSPDLSQAM